MKANKLLIFSLFCLICGCTSDQPDLLDLALRSSGPNRATLETVLAHYSVEEKDSLKLRAAKFLISNMAPHYGFQGEEIELYYNTIDSIAALSSDRRPEQEIREALENVKTRFGRLKPKRAYDLLSVSADFLTANIDRAMRDWQQGQWAQHLSFEQFCEFLLPCRVCDGQTLDDWRERLSTDEFGDLSNQKYLTADHSAFLAAKIVNRAMEKHLRQPQIEIALPSVRRMTSLIGSPVAHDCSDLSIAAAAAMRAKGIPVAIDFTPVWPNGRLGHTWCALLRNSGRIEPFNGMSHTVTTETREPMSKAYRHTWAINLELLKLNQSGEPVPDLFRNICIKDVTDEYMQTSDVEIAIEPGKNRNRYAWLCTFNDAEWTPVAMGTVKGRKASFEKVGRDVAYIVALTEADGLQFVSQPFALTQKGEIKPFTPDQNIRQTLCLKRKHPVSYLFANEGWLIIGSRFEAANRADFSDATTLGVIETYGTESGKIFPQNSDRPARYYRLLSAPEGYCAMAELYFCSDGQVVNNRGAIIGTAGERSDQKPARLFDDDAETSFSAPVATGGWAGLDFGQATAIDSIVYIPKMDANGITPGDEYELCYWDNNRWTPLGRKTAADITVSFDNCPVGALFLLHNLTRGKEERIFEVEDGEVRWW